ncbi:MAG: hypothetical protein RL757_3114 [Bacteroidota bacterium]|jgi:hypothetical protein
MENDFFLKQKYFSKKAKKKAPPQYKSTFWAIFQKKSLKILSDFQAFLIKLRRNQRNECQKFVGLLPKKIWQKLSPWLANWRFFLQRIWAALVWTTNVALINAV